jgi:hypothetical protein
MTESRSTTGSASFVAETRGNPLGAFPSLVVQGRPYNLWLTEALLDPLLALWQSPRAEASGSSRPVADEVGLVSERCRRAFQEVLPAAISAGDPALLAAFGVTANLQRTAAVIGEYLGAGGQLGPGGTEGPGFAFRLSRWWCGLTEYAEGSPYFPARVHPPVHAGRLNIRRRDARHLANALWCSTAAITARLEEATLRLRDAIRRSGLYEPGDLQHLRGPSVSLRSRERK